MSEKPSCESRNSRPLWATRLLIVVFSPVLVLLALALALIEGFMEGARECKFEFVWMCKDIVRLWREGQ